MNKSFGYVALSVFIFLGGVINLLFAEPTINYICGFFFGCGSMVLKRLADDEK